jgi:8-oxo-dGTP diphosphatase
VTAVNDLHGVLEAHGLTVVRVLRDTTSGQTLAVQGPDGTMTILKASLGADPEAAARHDTELAVYRAMRTVLPAGWHAPALLDAGELTLTLQYLPGAPVGEGRYPGEISRYRAEQALGALTALHRWRPPNNAVPSWPRTRVCGPHAGPNPTGILTTADLALVTRLSRPVWARIEHGDPLPGNMLCGEHGVALVDFEHTGWQPAGTDWALMDLLWSPGNPWLRPHLSQRAASEDCAPGYALALLLFAAHEIHLHQTVFPPSHHQQRADVLAANLSYARNIATTIAGAAMSRRTDIDHIRTSEARGAGAGPPDRRRPWASLTRRATRSRRRRAHARTRLVYSRGPVPAGETSSRPTSVTTLVRQRGHHLHDRHGSAAARRNSGGPDRLGPHLGVSARTSTTRRVRRVRGRLHPHRRRLVAQPRAPLAATPTRGRRQSHLTEPAHPQPIFRRAPHVHAREVSVTIDTDQTTATAAGPPRRSRTCRTGQGRGGEPYSRDRAGRHRPSGCAGPHGNAMWPAKPGNHVRRLRAAKLWRGVRCCCRAGMPSPATSGWSLPPGHRSPAGIPAHARERERRTTTMTYPVATGHHLGADADGPHERLGSFVQVVVGILRIDDRLVLVREHRDRAGVWTLPGGGVLAGELVVDALAREIREETGLRLGGPPQLAFTVNTVTTVVSHMSAVALFFDCHARAGALNPCHDPDGDIAEARLVATDTAIDLLSGSTADRPEIEPVLAYLSGSRRLLWCYRNGEPAAAAGHEPADTIASGAVAR